MKLIMISYLLTAICLNIWDISNLYNETNIRCYIMDTLEDHVINGTCTEISRNDNFSNMSKIFLIISRNPCKLYFIDRSNIKIEEINFFYTTESLLCKKVQSIIRNYVKGFVYLYFSFLDRKNEDIVKIITLGNEMKVFKSIIIDPLILKPFDSLNPVFKFIYRHKEYYFEEKKSSVEKIYFHKKISNLNENDIEELITKFILKISDLNIKNLFFIDVRKYGFHNFSGTRFYWNCIQSMLEDEKFSAYYNFYHMTSLYQDDLVDKISIKDMLNKIKTVKYDDLQYYEKKECENFAYETFFILFGKMNNKTKYDLLISSLKKNSNIHDINLREDFKEYIKSLLSRTLSKIDAYLKIADRILSGRYNPSIYGPNQALVKYDDENLDYFKIMLRKLYRMFLNNYQSDQCAKTIQIDKNLLICMRKCYLNFIN